MSTTEITPVTNLPAARAEKAVARTETALAKTRHPAGKQTPAKAPAKKVAASTAKITWKNHGEKDAKGQCEGTGTCGDRTYQITGSGENWKCTVQVGKGKPSVLGENLKSGGAAWRKCVDDNKGRAAA